MRITEIKLAQYRNYTSLSLQPHPEFTILYGSNAQGKTNVLEAIRLCSAGRSHRTNRDAQLIQWEADGSYIRTNLERAGSERSIEIRLRKQKPKQIKLDGNPISRIGDLMGCLNVVFFSPEDLRLVKDGPSERRRFMDTELSQMKPVYFYSLLNYQQALGQRNALLKELSFKYPSASEAKNALEPWDLLLAQYGAEIIIERQSFLESLSKLAEGVHRSISAGKESLVLRYDASLKAESKEKAEEELLNALSIRRADELRKGQTLSGPHRDDIELRLDGMDLRAYASQGQQRTAALALKLSEIFLLKEHSGESPVLLLDDVMSELDSDRQSLLLEAASSAQTFLACTHIPDNVNGDVYCVQNGVLKRIK